MTGMDVHQRDDLAFPQSLPEFQELFPDDATCAAYLERSRWRDGFVCPHCGVLAEPFRIATRPGILQCRTCRRQTGLLVGTVMERSHTALNVWFWAAYLVASQTPGISAVQFQRQLGLSRYETAFGILHKLRAGMVRPDQDRIGGLPDQHVEVDETYVGGRTRGEGRGSITRLLSPVRSKSVTVSRGLPRISKDGRYAGGVRLAVASDRSAESSADLSRAPLLQERWSSLMIGVALLGYARWLQPSRHCRMRRSGSGRGVPANNPSCIRQPQDVAEQASTTASAPNIYKPTSTSLHFASTDASTHSTRSVLWSEWQAGCKRQPLPNYIPATGYTLDLVGVCVYRIGKLRRQPLGVCEGLSDDGDCQRNAGYNSDRRVGQRPDPLGVDAFVQHVRQIIFDEGDMIYTKIHVNCLHECDFELIES